MKDNNSNMINRDIHDIRDINNNITDNSINVNNYTNIFIREKEIEKQRPRLENIYENSRYTKDYTVRCTGVLIGKTVKVKNRILHRVLNVMDNNGLYVADHIHLDLSNIRDYDSNFIEFIGKVQKYKKNDGSYDYEIKLTQNVIWLPDIYTRNQRYDYYVPDYNQEKILAFRNKLSKDDYYNMIEKLRLRLNNITYEFGNNFIYNYIINVFMINTATTDLYKSDLRGMDLSIDTLLKFILVTANVINTLETMITIEILELFKMINNMCNIVQGITDYKHQSKEFEIFCENELKLYKHGRKSDQLWNNVRHRMRNFGKDPNPYGYTLEDLSMYAYYVIHQYL